MRPNNNKTTRMKPVTKTLAFVVSGKDRNGYDYNADSAKNIVADLQTNGTFEKLSVMAVMAKKIAFNKEDARGTLSVARIQKYDTETGEMDLLFFGKGTEFAEKMDNMVVIPNVRRERDSDMVSSILSFEIVDAMDA